ncbi:MAG: glutamate-1-semialdehyde 2,1-aminomutase [Flavobacteriales bacterium]
MFKARSAQLFEAAKELFPGGVNSPVRAFRSVGGTPLFIQKGKGSHIWDADGNKFIDYCCSWGPLILGHANDKVLMALEEVMKNGTSFGAPTEWENKLASLIITNNPYIQKLRFVSSGTEAVMSAIRLARGFTKRNKIIKFEGCYHGHADALLVKAGSGLVTLGNSSSAGVPPSVVDDTLVLPLNSTEALEEAFKKFGSEIACVIIEPVPANNGLLIQDKEYLSFLREITKQHGALLLFDEVITGFRLGFSGAAGFYGIQPDIITFGKIIGGGLPVGAYASSHEIMSSVSPEGNVYQAGTLSGNPMAMAAGFAQLNECLKPGFYTSLDRKCSWLADQLNMAAKEIGFTQFKVHHVGSIFWISFSDKPSVKAAHEIDAPSMEIFKKLYHQLLENGIYLGPSGYEVGFISDAHTTADLDRTILVFKKILTQFQAEQPA